MRAASTAAVLLSIRVASLSLVVALALAPLPAAAQNNTNALAARVAALEVAVAQLQAGLSNEVTNRVNAVAAEINARAAADTTLQSNITAEFNGRVGAVAQEISDRAAAVTTLQGQINKLKGNNITATDLEGAYNLYFIATAMDQDPAAGNANVIASYVIRGSLVLGPGGTGHGSAALASGSTLTERPPSQTWLAAGFKDVQFAGEGNLTWTYVDGTVTVTFDATPNDPTVVIPAGNGQVMVGIQGGPPGNNQAIMFLTRQP